MSYTYIYEYFIAFVLAFIIAFSATPIVRKIAFNIGAVDIPKDHRRMHRKPIARFGGLAIIFGFLITVFFNILGNLFNITSVFVPDRQFFGMLGGILIIAVEGIADDIKPLRPRTKFVFQILAAIVVVSTGTVISCITNPFSPVGFSQLSPYISYPLTIIWIVGITNAINFIDGLDGLAAGVSSIASVSLFFISVGMGDIDTAIVAAIIVGATLGFLPYNFNPAKIFMGETGSAFLGFVLGVVSIRGLLKSYTAVAIAVPLLVLGLPLFDAVLAIVRRLIRKKSIAEADKSHFHHRLVGMGLSHKQTVIVLYIASAVLGLCAIVLAEKGPLSAIILVISVSAVVIAGVKYMGEIDNERNLKNKVDSSELLVNGSNITDEKRINGIKTIKVMTVFGTRPDAVKMAPLVREMEKYEQIDSIICVTAQHRQMLDQVLDIFDITPDFDLNIMQNRQSLEYITTRVLESLSRIFEQIKPDIVLVHGDTSTCFVASLAAFYKKIAIGHVEAGLRTFDKYFPYPEEMNRKLAGALSDLHFAPTAINKINLLNEGVKESKIYVTGNTIIDALKTTIAENYIFENEKIRSIDFSNKRIITVTAHRRENLGEPLNNICNALKYIADKYVDVEIVYPVHLNPVVQETVKNVLDGHPRIHLINPTDVRELHNLMNKSYFVMTDSGGLQEEAPSLGKPVLVLRNETERPEAVDAGTVKLAGTETGKIISLATQLLDDTNEYNKMAKSVNPYGDGKASERIVGAILYEFGLNDNKPEEFII